jgi:hypothetical protein
MELVLNKHAATGMGMIDKDKASVMIKIQQAVDK